MRRQWNKQETLAVQATTFKIISFAAPELPSSTGVTIPNQEFTGEIWIMTPNGEALVYFPLGLREYHQHWSRLLHDYRFPEKQEIATGLLRRGIVDGSMRLPYQAIIEFVAAAARPDRCTFELGCAWSIIKDEWVSMNWF